MKGLTHYPSAAPPVDDAPDVVIHTLCGNNVRRFNTSTNLALINCRQCARALARRDREAGQHKPETITRLARVLTLTVNEPEFCAILAGLRLLQSTLGAYQTLDPEIMAIFNNDGQIVPLIATEPFKQQDEFDRLCERLNLEAGRA